MSYELDRLLKSPMQGSAAAQADYCETTLDPGGKTFICVECGAVKIKYEASWSINLKADTFTGTLCSECSK